MSTIQAHDDAVSCLSIRDHRLLTGSWDATVKLWQLRESEIERTPLFGKHNTPTHECANGRSTVCGEIVDVMYMY